VGSCQNLISDYHPWISVYRKEHYVRNYQKQKKERKKSIVAVLDSGIDLLTHEDLKKDVLWTIPRNNSRKQLR